MSGWSAGSALARTISPSLWGCTGLASTIIALGVGAETLGGVVEVLVGIDPQAAAPDVGVVAAGEEPDLGVVGVVVAEAGGEPGARLVQRRRHEAVAGGRPLGEAPLGLVP